MTTFLSLFLALLASFQPGAPKPEPTRVMILGVLHFASNADHVKGPERDVMGEVMQKEIGDVLDRLAAFKPDKIFIERLASDQAALDASYQAFLKGEREAGKNESDQLGARLAKRLGHQRLYAFDHRSDMNFQPLMELAGKSGRPELIQQFQAKVQFITTKMAEIAGKYSVAEQLAIMNTPSFIEGGHRLYMWLLGFDTPDAQPAAAMLAGWYERNLKMHTSMRRVVKPGDRVLVIVGAGHAKHLRDFVRQELPMQLVEPADSLPKAPAVDFAGMP